MYVLPLLLYKGGYELFPKWQLSSFLFRQVDFSEDRQRAVAKKSNSTDLLEEVRKFAEPGKDFLEEVLGVDDDLARLGGKLTDLREHSDETAKMV